MLSSVLTMMVAGGSVLMAGGMAKIAGTWACVTVPRWLFWQGGNVHTCGNPAIHTGHHGSDPGVLPAACS
jgi:hypothetical protein